MIVYDPLRLALRDGDDPPSLVLETSILPT